MKRQVLGLKWARRLDSKPSCIPNGRARGKKGLGIRYEKDLKQAYSAVLNQNGVWFEFEDKNGHGYCQVDFLLEDTLRQSVFVIEAKHTWTEDGHVELEKLYLPVVKMALEARNVSGIVVCKKLLPYMHGIEVVPTLAGAISASGKGRTVWHWITTGVFPRPRKAAKRNGHNSPLAGASATS